MDNILSTGTDITVLPDSVYQTALQSLSLDNVSTRGMAEILQHFREGIYHPLIALNPEAEAEERPAAGRQENLPIQLDLKVKVMPSPFNNEVSFDLSGMAKGEYTLTITDLLGKVIWSKQSNGGQVLVWVSSKLPDGQYLYLIRSEKGFVQSGKLLKVNK